MARALKTFQAHLGFYDTVVAAPSRAAALKAWGSRQNLFRDGQAKETKDPQAVAAATAKPGVVLRRPVGSNGPFSENPDLPKVSAQPKLKLVHSAKTEAAPKKKAAPERPPPDRRPIERAEKALAKLREDERRALAEMDARKAALDKEEQRVRSEFRRRREAAEKALAQARVAYQQALRGA
jgi:hypothetical protein